MQDRVLTPAPTRAAMVPPERTASHRFFQCDAGSLLMQGDSLDSKDESLPSWPAPEACDPFDGPRVEDVVAGFFASPAALEGSAVPRRQARGQSPGANASPAVNRFSTPPRGLPFELQLLESREELRRLSELLVSAQEDERRRIALDLHDGLGQSLSLIKLSIEHSARLLVGGATAEAGDALQQVLPRVREALAEVRRVSSELRPPILDDLGILPTLSWFVRDFSSVAGGVQVETTLDVAEQDVPLRLHITIFRIVQEAFHNVIKHAQASRVRVRLERVGATLDLLIEDDGRGFDPQTVKCAAGHSRGLGLLSMRERAALTGGTYHLESARGRGTCIRASWPCQPPD